ncbi:uncharacterized protein N7459_004362 [Penicillium hispanicum]|uniref:uncharacterized protein n=1 Tax=Penicillium hispanicum TaxID=1080232 RepID=UPI002540C9BB|nr:uncharacterized protein N7459_004362 [Penicillium hispanicum]KAJ5584562.1 hypothetical protein N7459_004362 [Penicillium hispanicum]
MDNSNLPLFELAGELNQVFAAAMDFQEGKITPEQLTMVADRSAWKTARLLHPTLLPIDDLTLYEVKSIFPEIAFSNERKPWVKARVDISMPRPFRRMMTIRDFPNEHRVTRRTGLDIVLQFVQQHVDPSISQNLSLENGIELGYKSIIYNGKKCCMYGSPYYSLWYGDRDDMAVNFVAVYSKRPATHGEAQVLAYMGKY